MGCGSNQYSASTLTNLDCLKGMASGNGMNWYDRGCNILSTGYLLSLLEIKDVQPKARGWGLFFLFIVCFVYGVHHLPANLGNPSSLGLLGQKVGRVVKNKSKKINK